MRSIFFIFLIWTLFTSCRKRNPSSFEQLNFESVVKIISTKTLSDFHLDSVIDIEKDSIYSLFFFNPEINKNVFDFFFKHKTPFYVFQKNRMIYHNLSNEFFGNENINSSDYILYADKGKTLHRLMLENYSRLTFLVKHEKKEIVQDIFEISNLQRFPKAKLISDKVPLMEINTLNTSISDYSFQSVEVKISTEKEVIETPIKLKIRGSSSKAFPKKQLSIKSSNSYHFRGISIDKSVMYAPYIDKSLLRNKLTYDLYAQMTETSNPSVFMNLLLNGDYYGIYLFVAHPKAQFKNIINSSDSSSFMVKLDRCPCEIKHAINSRKTAYIIESPDKCLKPKKEKIDKALSAFEKALLIGDLCSLDFNSFIDFIILNELSKNIDAYRLSTYLSFYSNKFRLPVVWDYNIAWGLAEYGDALNPEGFVINGEFQSNHHFWWDNLWENKLFQTELRHRYLMHRENVLSEDNILKLIDLSNNTIKEYKALNFKKWPLMRKKIWPSKYKTKTHSEELDILKTWLGRRLDWLDKQWGNSPP